VCFVVATVKCWVRTVGTVRTVYVMSHQRSPDKKLLFPVQKENVINHKHNNCMTKGNKEKLSFIRKKGRMA